MEKNSRDTAEKNKWRENFGHPSVNPKIWPGVEIPCYILSLGLTSATVMQWYYIPKCSLVLVKHYGCSLFLVTTATSVVANPRSLGWLSKSKNFCLLLLSYSTWCHRPSSVVGMHETFTSDQKNWSSHRINWLLGYNARALLDPFAVSDLSWLVSHISYPWSLILNLLLLVASPIIVGTSTWLLSLFTQCIWVWIRCEKEGKKISSILNSVLLQTTEIQP